MKKLMVWAALALLTQTAPAQRLSYIVSFPNIAHHEAQITLVASDINTRGATFRMSRSSPGRYATHEFGKNIYDIKAFDQQGKPLTVNKVDGDVYEVPRHGGYIKFQYTLYANYPDGTYAGIDENRIHLNMPAAFIWLKGTDNVPISIHFNVPDSLHWTIATQLEPTTDPRTFTARGLQYFMDCPTKIGPLRYRRWEVKNPDGKSYSFRIALDGDGPDTAFTRFSEKVQQIVTQAQRVFGETPAYDYGSYTFLASINPYVEWDGMEHRNSTMISIAEAFDGDNRLLGVFSHEFFHCWNVKRIRPRTLEPFNFEKSNMSHELWFAEGFTQYYGDLLVLRSGIGSDTTYAAKTLAGLINTKVNTPGGKFYSPVDASRMAVFVDAGVAVDKTNYPNFYTSYYPYGGALALALDLELREKYQKTLDDYMQAVWKKFGKPEVPYTIPGLEDVLESVTGDKAWAREWFDKYIYGHEAIDYAALLAPAGFLVQPASPGKAWIGNARYTDKNGLVIANNTVRGTPLYEAGLDVDDQLLELAGQTVATAADVTRILSGLQPGATISVHWKHQGLERAGMLRLQENPALAITAVENAGQTLTPAMQTFRQHWLSGKN